PQEWGVVTVKNKTLYAHILQKPRQEAYIFIPELKEKVVKAVTFSGKSTLKFKQLPEGLFIYLTGVSLDDVDTVIAIELK
ncbi:MAG: alpha-L-fucosidase, partial [Chitinophagaceae bacterium]|nr:alpha-L-fucosidase [Chitinophagaceae bacterium]